MKPLPNSEEYQAFSLKKQGLPVKIFSVVSLLDYVPVGEGTETYHAFFKDSQINWIIPIDLYDEGGQPGGVLGFLLRAFAIKGYRMVLPEDKPQCLYGWHRFASYKRGMPIILTEGVKDGDVVSTVYPYVLSMLTSDMSEDTGKLLASMTSDVGLMLDNDKGGVFGVRECTRKLAKRGVRVKSSTPMIVKDFGAYILRPNLMRLLKSQVESVVGETILP